MRTTSVLAALVVLACLVLPLASFAADERLVANRAFLIDFGHYKTRMDAQIVKMNEQLKKSTDVAKKLRSGSYVTNLDPKEWALDKWEVELNSSASTVENNVLSYVTAVTSREWEGNYKKYYDGQKIAGYTNGAAPVVLGARIHFPTSRFNCWAKIHPPFEINAYDEDGQLANEFNGILDNVGQIQSVSVWVKGRNYQNSLAVRMKDREGSEREYFLGDLNFDNWRELTWTNPNYIENPKDRYLTRLPLYPRSRPFIKFSSFIIYRQMDMVGGDFIVYIRDVKVSYDKAVYDDAQPDIDDEKVWRILSERRRIEKDRELSKLAEKQILQQQEEAKLRKTKTQ